MDLQSPERKMSKTGGTEQGTVFVLDPPEVIRRKVMGAVTDSGAEIVRRSDKAGISNLIEVLAVLSATPPEEVEALFGGRGYGAFKEAVAETVVEYLAPVQKRYADLRADEGALEKVLSEGAAKARAIASETVGLARERMGVGPRRS